MARETGIGHRKSAPGTWSCLCNCAQRVRRQARQYGMLKKLPAALLFALAVTLTIGVAGPFASNANAADFQQVGRAGEIYAWTAGC